VPSRKPGRSETRRRKEEEEERRRRRRKRRRARLWQVQVCQIDGRLANFPR